MKKILISITIVLLVFTLSTCFFTGNTSVSVSPVIKAIGMPTGITSVELTVSGPGMNTIDVVYDSLPSTIDLTVPTGSHRTFELVVYVDTPIIAATSYKGTTTVDLSQGNAEVNLTMRVGSTKLIIPDAFNNRIIQIDDMAGNNWSTVTQGGLIGWPAVDFLPWDIDFDNEGRILIANNGDMMASPIIWRINSISDPVYTPLNIGTAWGYIAIAADRKNNLIYFASTTQLYSCNNFGTDLVSTYDMTGITTINGLAVDENGVVYIADSGSDSIFKYNPISQSIIGSNSSVNLNFPWDILVKDDHIYVANYAGVDNWKIIKFDQNLDSEVGFGKISGDTDTTPNYFRGPRKFIAISPKKFYLIDENGSSFGDVERVVAFSDEFSSIWEAFEPSTIGQTPFIFYDC